MAIFNIEYLEEKYVSKYAEYLDDTPDEDEENDDDDDIDEEDAKELESYYKSKNKNDSNTSPSSNKKAEEEPKNNKEGSKSSFFSSLKKAGRDYENQNTDLKNHLTKDEIRRAISIVMNDLNQFPRLKKCCDFVDLNDREEINDDGEHESAFEKYFRSSPYSFIEIINGDSLPGYPNSRNDSEDLESDSRKFVKMVNDSFEAKKINAKLVTNPHKDDDVVSFGIKSTKGKNE